MDPALRWYTAVRGLVFGGYGEASVDVHSVLRAAAHALAAREWRLAGARSETEMRSFAMARVRRRMGVAAVQAMARHRLARVPYVGVPRAMVEGRVRREDVFWGAQVYDPSQFFAAQAGYGRA